MFKMEDEFEDVEVIEVEMTDSHIDELMGKLNDLRDSKDKVTVELASDLELVINYVEEEEENGS